MQHAPRNTSERVTSGTICVRISDRDTRFFSVPTQLRIFFPSLFSFLITRMDRSLRKLGAVFPRGNAPRWALNHKIVSFRAFFFVISRDIARSKNKSGSADIYGNSQKLRIAATNTDRSLPFRVSVAHSFKRRGKLSASDVLKIVLNVTRAHVSCASIVRCIDTF